MAISKENILQLLPSSCQSKSVSKHHSMQLVLGGPSENAGGRWETCSSRAVVEGPDGGVEIDLVAKSIREWRTFGDG